MVHKRSQTTTEFIQIAGHPVLVNRKAIRNLILRVRPDGCLSLSLPRSCSLVVAEHFVRSKEAWITKTTAGQREASRRKAAAEPQLYQEGDLLFVLGKPCILHWQVEGYESLCEMERCGLQVPSHAEIFNEKLKLESCCGESSKNKQQYFSPNGPSLDFPSASFPNLLEDAAKQENKNPKTSLYELCLSLPAAYSPSLPEDAAKREKRVWSFYKEVLEQQISGLLPIWKRRLNIERQTPLYFQKMKSRWGSCQTKSGRLCFNTRLAEYPEELIEYVLVHELTHFDEPSHNKVFYALMERRLPGWKKYRKALRVSAEELYRQTSAIES